MFDLDPVSLARSQFATTALYHFLFVPLTLGLAFLLAIMESAYVMTEREIWRDATRFWGKLFGINFAMGVATGITMEFQFGTNWAYYSHYVGDVFGAPLAIEGLMAFFLESTFVGLFFFGRDRLPRLGHLAVTWLVALGSNKAPILVSDVVEAIENACGPGLDDTRGRRARPIVRDYHLEAFIGLCREATQHGIKRILAIIGCDDDGDEFGHGTGSRGASGSPESCTT